jgi:hypothetical protein
MNFCVGAYTRRSRGKEIAIVLEGRGVSEEGGGAGAIAVRVDAKAIIGGERL